MKLARPLTAPVLPRHDPAEAATPERMPRPDRREVREPVHRRRLGNRRRLSLDAGEDERLDAEVDGGLDRRIDEFQHQHQKDGTPEQGKFRSVFGQKPCGGQKKRRQSGFLTESGFFMERRLQAA